jgi:hypothetical protein
VDDDRMIGGSSKVTAADGSDDTMLGEDGIIGSIAPWGWVSTNPNIPPILTPVSVQIRPAALPIS